MCLVGLGASHAHVMHICSLPASLPNPLLLSFETSANVHGGGRADIRQPSPLQSLHRLVRHCNHVNDDESDIQLFYFLLMPPFSSSPSSLPSSPYFTGSCCPHSDRSLMRSQPSPPLSSPMPTFFFFLISSPSIFTPGRPSGRKVVFFFFFLNAPGPDKSPWDSDPVRVGLGPPPPVPDKSPHGIQSRLESGSDPPAPGPDKARRDSERGGKKAYVTL